ncbi:MAG: translation initiation factor IF-3 [Chloroflexota bacterium]|nr:translation initiation factor IF-3 [Chloroflexota bacterium]MDE2941681.1 translation initiation factor IF-3 [Chloroflexota bacterium]MDE3267132.1 translation initiation factor IF-3 [Chloroflexota bacterium]
MLYSASLFPNQRRGKGIPREYRTNQRIRVPEVLVIDEQGEQLGTMPTLQAVQLAQERGLDLVEVAPAAQPPVCRLLDYGKFRYIQTKKEREGRKTQKVNLLREVRFRPRIGEHDMAAKRRIVKKLLDEGSKVKLTVMFRGREITHQDLGVELLRKTAEAFKDEAKLEKAPTMEGRRLSIVISPISQQRAKVEKEQDAKAVKEQEAVANA